LGRITPDFLWRLEEVLDLYAKEHDSNYPVVCFDERPTQLIGDVMVPVPMKKPGSVKKIDYQYERKGTCSILSAIEPLTGKRLTQVRPQRKRQDYAEFMDALKDRYPKAKKIILVQDNLNTHTPGSFYEAYPAEKAFKLAQRFNMIYTPKKASWLNMAEIEFSALSKQCLDRRIDCIKELTEQVLTCSKEREQKKIKINWQFTKEKARVKLKRHYQITKITNSI
jgi:hypothetical protein